MLFLFNFDLKFKEMDKDKAPKKSKKNSNQKNLNQKNLNQKKEMIINENSSPVCYAKSKEIRDEYK